MAIEVFADASLIALRNSGILADDIDALQRDWDERMAGLRSDATARVLARLSIEYPVLTTNVGIAGTGASQPAVRNGIDQLVHLGILTPANSRQRNRIWANDGVIAALDAFAERSGRRQDAPS